ncbi:peptidylprolyl isomerase [Candidatus Rubidus massiliensis]|nr:MAG: hypothetical protein BGO10_07070 [Chlamydia sp. 32-24]CDZ80449.1 peptidylprolyl isomerase [Candidatus Rubidus massiliensis]
MKKLFTIACLTLPFFATSVYAAKGDILIKNEANAKLAIHNRVLAKVNGKPITVMDVVKRMDLIFYKQFPQFASSIQAKYQFYQINWKEVLKDLIEKELVLAEADEQKIPVSNGDVRQEMENMFGPNIIANLDKAGLTFDEAFKIIQGDIKLKRMLYVRVNMKVLKKVTPKDVRTFYENNLDKYQQPESFVYHVVSLRTKESEKGKDAAQYLYDQLKNGIKINDLKTVWENSTWAQSDIKFQVSQEYKQESKDVSEANKKILNTLDNLTFSEPQSQKSRQDSSTVYRIFYLVKKVNEGFIPFAEAEQKIKSQLLNQALDEEGEVYINKLKKHFDIQELLKEDFEPFILTGN